MFIGAACAGGALLPSWSVAAPQLPVQHWRGNALGAHATVQLVGVSRQKAELLFGEIETELERLEQMFSLYRKDSSLARLNATGRLDAPPQEFLEVLSVASAAHQRTGGLFDPSVQPLFVLYAEHFAVAGASGTAPTAGQLRSAIERVGFDKVVFDADQVRFTQFGMALTLNGVAQGYISDRIAHLLRNHGLDNVLVNMGEIAALGAGPQQTGWRVGIASAVAGADSPRLLTLSDRAVATSSLMGTVLDPDGRIGHIFRPGLGPVVPSVLQVSIVDASVALADALSTGAALMDEAGIEGLRQSGVEIYI